MTGFQIERLKRVRLQRQTLLRTIERLQLILAMTRRLDDALSNLECAQIQIDETDTTAITLLSEAYGEIVPTALNAQALLDAHAKEELPL
jgi:hypothetical protein